LADWIILRQHLVRDRIDAKLPGARGVSPFSTWMLRILRMDAPAPAGPRRKGNTLDVLKAKAMVFISTIKFSLSMIDRRKRF